MIADYARQRRGRRHPRLLAAAPLSRSWWRKRRRPFLTDAQIAKRSTNPSKTDRARKPATYGAGTVEYLVGAGRADLLPRGQHPPAGRTPGHRGDLRHRPRARAVQDRRWRVARLRRPDAARAQLRIPYQRRGPRPRLPPGAGHRNPVRRPGRPRVRLDAGVESGSVIGGQFDSCWQSSSSPVRRGSRPSSVRAARSTNSSSKAWRRRSRSTRQSSATPAFTSEPFTIHNRWIETEFDNQIPPSPAASRPRPTSRARCSWSRWVAAGWRSRSPRASGSHPVAAVPAAKRRQSDRGRRARLQRRPATRSPHRCRAPS